MVSSRVLTNGLMWAAKRERERKTGRKYTQSYMYMYCTTTRRIIFLCCAKMGLRSGKIFLDLVRNPICP